MLVSHKHEDVSLISITHIEKLSMVVVVVMLVIPELGRGDRQVTGSQWPVRLTYKMRSKLVRDPASNK